MTPTLLLVDDEPAIIDAIESSLFDEHYTIYKASCAAEALSVLEQHTITVIIADQVMPGMSGIELCATVHQKWPTTYRILLSSQEQSLEPAALNGDVHQCLAKPWDAMLLRYNINEGIRQQRILQQALTLSASFQHKDQACLITDKNWVIQLASISTARWLGVDSEKLIGKNLFSRDISNNSIEEETKLINVLESQSHWQGSFHLNTSSIHGNEAWMCVVPFAEAHYLCLAIPMIDDMLNQLSGEAKQVEYDNEPLKSNTTRLFRYLKIVISHQEKQSLDFITVVNERLQLASDNLYKIFSTLEGDHVIQVPGYLKDEHINNLLAAIHQGFLEPILFHGLEHTIKWQTEEIKDNGIIEKKPTSQKEQASNLEHTTKQSYQGHSYFQPQQFSNNGFSCLPIFDQHGQAVALMPPSCENREEIEQWLSDAIHCSNEWRTYSDKVINWVNDLSGLKPHQLLKALAAIASLIGKKGQEENSWQLILSAEQIMEIKRAEQAIRQQLEHLNIKLFIKNPDYHLNTIKDFEHSLPSLFSGLCIDHDWLFNKQQVRRNSMTLLNYLRSHDLTILALGIQTAEQLALLHNSPCHWLAGDILSVKLLPQQISWLHQ